GAFAAADVEHRAQRPLQVVLGGRHRQRHLARQALRAADAAAAVPGVEVASVVALLHLGPGSDTAGYNSAAVAPRPGRGIVWTPTGCPSRCTCWWCWRGGRRCSTCRGSCSTSPRPATTRRYARAWC